MRIAPAMLASVGVFVVAARHENFARAAEELDLTSSAVSHHVRTLEAALRIKLFQRHARGAQLTADGRMLASAAAAALSDLDRVVQSLEGAPRNAQRLRVATLQSLNHCWILPRLLRFTTANPRVRLSFSTGIALTRFDNSGPDVAVRYGEGHWPGLTAHHLMDEELFPVAAPSLLKGAGRPDVAAVARLPLVTDRTSQGWTDWFRAAGQRGISESEMYTFTDSIDAMRAATAGLGAFLARSRLVEAHLERGELVRLPGPALEARFAYYAVYPSNHRLSAPAAAFVEWMRDEARVPVRSPRSR